MNMMGCRVLSLIALLAAVGLFGVMHATQLEDYNDQMEDYVHICDQADVTYRELNGFFKAQLSWLRKNSQETHEQVQESYQDFKDAYEQNPESALEYYRTYICTLHKENLQTLDDGEA